METVIERIQKRPACFYESQTEKLLEARKVEFESIRRKSEILKQRQKDRVNSRKTFVKKSQQELAANRRDRGHIRRLKEKGITPKDSKLIRKWETAWRSKPKAICYWCTKIFKANICHVDHIVPVKLYGPHEIGNLCIACPRCNLRKSAKTINQWNEKLERPVLL